VGIGVLGQRIDVPLNYWRSSDPAIVGDEESMSGVEDKPGPCEPRPALATGSVMLANALVQLGEDRRDTLLPSFPLFFFYQISFKTSLLAL